MDHHSFIKYYIIFYAQINTSLYEFFFLSTPQEIDKYLPIQLEAGQI
jgi:hypothetical protein